MSPSFPQTQLNDDARAQLQHANMCFKYLSATQQPLQNDLAVGQAPPLHVIKDPFWVGRVADMLLEVFPISVQDVPVLEGAVVADVVCGSVDKDTMRPRVIVDTVREACVFANQEEEVCGLAYAHQQLLRQVTDLPVVVLTHGQWYGKTYQERLEMMVMMVKKYCG